MINSSNKSVLLAVFLGLVAINVHAATLGDLLKKANEMLVEVAESAKKASNKDESEENNQTSESQTSKPQASAKSSPPPTPATRPTPIILTIDGIEKYMLLKSVGKIVAPEGRANSYLQEYVEVWGLAKKEDLFYVPWTGATKDTEMMVERTKEYILSNYTIAKNRNQPFVIIAHSWGGVLASDALANLRWENKIPDDAIDLLITVGTPVRDKKILANLSHAYNDITMVDASKVVKRWKNYHNKKDFFSSEFGYDDKTSTTRVSTGLSDEHAAYYQDSLIWNGINKDTINYLNTLPVTSTNTSTSTSTKFAIGDKVETTGSLNVRRIAGGDLLGTQASGSRGQIVGGPVRSGKHDYWQIDYAGAVDGWSVESALQKSSSTDRSAKTTKADSTGKTNSKLPSYSRDYCLSQVCIGQPVADLELDLDWQRQRGNTGIGDRSSQEMHGINDEERKRLWNFGSDPKEFIRVLGKVNTVCSFTTRWKTGLELPDTHIQVGVVAAVDGGWQGYQVIGISRKYVVPLSRREEWLDKVRSKYPESSSGPITIQYGASESGGRATITLRDERFGRRGGGVGDYRKHPKCQPENKAEFSFD